MTRPSAAAPGFRVGTAADGVRMEEIRLASWRAAYGDLLPEAAFAAFDPPAGAERLRRGLARGGALLLAPAVGTAQAFLRYGPARDEDVHGDEIYACYAVPEAWSTGLGRTLIAEALTRTRRPLTLWVLQANPRARRFYERAGFAPDGLIKDIDLYGRTLPEMRYRLDAR